MWNLPQPNIRQVRAHLDFLFPDGGGLAIGKAQKDLLEKLYKEYLAAQGRPNVAWMTALSPAALEAIGAAYSQTQDGRLLALIRETLRLEVQHCPYCGFGEIKDLDHHLQKNYYPCFSIFPTNLVPACAKCNGHKPRKPRANRAKQHIHAYLEKVPSAPFLKADILCRGKALTVSFCILRHRTIDGEMFARLEQHLIDFKLNDRFPIRIITFLVEQFPAFRYAYGPGGNKGLMALRDFLDSTAASYETSYGANDWRTALMKALRQHRAFCNGGFLRILGP